MTINFVEDTSQNICTWQLLRELWSWICLLQHIDIFYFILISAYIENLQFGIGYSPPTDCSEHHLDSGWSNPFHRRLWTELRQLSAWTARYSRHPIHETPSYADLILIQFSPLKLNKWAMKWDETKGVDEWGREKGFL